MIVLPQRVKIKLASKNIEYYKSKGYNIPLRSLKGQANQCRKKRDWGYDLGAELDIDVLDLPNGSNAFIDVKCDECGQVYKIIYKSYLSSCKKNNGKYFCWNCKVKKPRKPQQENVSRDTLGYRHMVKEVLKRDNYTCQCCGKVATDVHHLNGFNWFIEGREDPNNCVSLCYSCHIEFHGKYNRGDNTKEQYDEWLKENQNDLINSDVLHRKNRPIYCFDNNKVYPNWNELNKDFDLSLGYKSYNMLNKKGKSQNSQITVIWYDEYLSMTEEERISYVSKKNFRGNCVEFICLDTGEVFNSGLVAAEKYHTTSSTITQSLDRESYAGRDEYGRPMHWMRYEEYLKASPEYIEKRLNYLPSYYKPVILLNTGELFDRYTTASKATGISNSTISNQARGKQISGGILPSGEQAHWMRLSDYKNLSPSEKNKIITNYEESFIEGSFLFEQRKEINL